MQSSKYKMQKWLLLDILTLYNLISTKSKIQNIKIQKIQKRKNTKMQKYKNAKYKMQSIKCKKWLLLEILTLYNLIFTKSRIQKCKV